MIKKAISAFIDATDEYLERIGIMIKINGKCCWNSRGLAAILEVGKNNMLKELRTLKILTSQNVPNMGFAQDHPGFFVVKPGKHDVVTTYYTELSVPFIKEKLSYMPRKKVKDFKFKTEKEDFSHIHTFGF